MQRESDGCAYMGALGVELRDAIILLRVKYYSKLRKKLGFALMDRIPRCRRKGVCVGCWCMPQVSHLFAANVHVVYVGVIIVVEMREMRCTAPCNGSHGSFPRGCIAGCTFRLWLLAIKLLVS